MDQLAAPPDADALTTLARRIDELYREPVWAVIESMTGARLVHDTLEQEGWDVEIALDDRGARFTSAGNSGGCSSYPEAFGFRFGLTAPVETTIRDQANNTEGFVL